MTQLLTTPRWRKSSYSNGAGGECVVVAEMTTGGVGVRDSKRSQGPRGVVRRGTWAGFVTALCGERLG
ncbi:DUF397 domain-containing protein [Streptomyces sp. NPDC002018]|uniref:DUF397 domain-containing protein n=1 Tax=Streptomyces sp. NPDC002018 TaxID=3364629 RepID=UPI00368188FE